ncbi:MAG TPA: UvrB/UvrC motif-containing protein [Candidatus Krumholzibacteria bacterium]|nr:UvrB/UvrC motif-containing protein [Candidatus Krumholzibacteria bacterium]
MVLCQVCKSKPAKVHYTEIVNNSTMAMNLCIECAEQKGIDVNKAGNFGLGDLVAGLIDSAADSESERISRVRCATCGYEYSDFKRIGRLGCPDCYAAFESQLLAVLRHVHGSTQHAGKKATRVSERAALRERVAALREDLALAVHAEDFERAAALRDEIRGLEARVEEES